jgi:predicted peptidase
VKAKLIFLLLMLQAIFLVGSSWAGTVETGFLNRTVRSGGSTYRYQVYVPRNHSVKKKWPVVLFLHGSGERGKDGLLQTAIGLPDAIRRHMERFPMVVVMPQCPANSHWTERQAAKQAIAVLDRAITEFNGDVERVYLTGLSMGGAGTWYLASRYPHKFAAVVPVCAWVLPPSGVDSIFEDLPADAQEIVKSEDPYLTLAKRLYKLPIWIFHGEADKVVLPQESRRMAEAFKTLNSTAKYTEYEKIGHSCWEQAYEEEDLINWMLEQRLGKNSANNGKSSE